MLEIIPIPAFRDNYIWLLHDKGHATVVDPGDAAPVKAELHARKLQLDAILITHHHHDHRDGVEELLASYPDAEVYAPLREHYTFAHKAVAEGDSIELHALDLKLQVLETPGHTLGHVVYYAAPHLFCGDTLFSCGCGRLFEGDCRQLYHSLQRLAALPEETQVYCAHEYTSDNIRFALTLDPNNSALQRRALQVKQLRQAGRPTLPTSIGLERATNPFLRCDTATPQLRDMLRQRQLLQADPVSIFCFVRELKNTF